jgi:1-acyl-sn-glycerol-3-phosphate acyltransferase
MGGEDGRLLLYRLAWVLLRIMLPVLGRWRVTGHENIPKSRGVIVAPNHISYADPPVVGAALRRHVSFMAKEELFKIPLLGPIIRHVGTFPVKQRSADRAALRHAMKLLEDGRVVCIFPEGMRSPDGTLQKPALGIGMVALKTRVPIVPMAIVGTDRLLPAHSVFVRFARVRVKIGTPVPLDDLYEHASEREAMEQVGERVMAAIAELQRQVSEELR